MTDSVETRVGLIGHGAIGRVVAHALAHGEVPGCTLGGVLVRHGGDVPAAVTDVRALCARSALVVEAAGHEALTEHAVSVLEQGRDLLVVSAGALADPELHDRVTAAGPGRLWVSSGAIGGLDALRAAHLAAPLERVELRTTKPAGALREPWMPAQMVRALDRGDQPVTVFSGTARESATRFPRSVNVAATLALATVGFDLTAVTVVGDPSADRVEHHITAAGPCGAYEFRFANRPSPSNPRTSAITPYAVLRALSDLHTRFVVGR